jgi:hypothetical protein
MSAFLLLLFWADLTREIYIPINESGRFLSAGRKKANIVEKQSAYVIGSERYFMTARLTGPAGLFFKYIRGECLILLLHFGVYSI